MSAGALLSDTVSRVPRPLLVDRATHRALVLRGLEGDPDGARVLDDFLSADRRRGRLTAFVSTVGLDELEPLLGRAEALAQATFPGAEVEVTGQFPLLIESQRHLLSTLTYSLGLTLVAIGLVLRWLLPGMRLALLALVPNVWPVVGMLGVMGWLGVPLDIATVMVASVVLGLAVDNTLHTLGHFRRLAGDVGAHEAVVRSLETTAPAYLLTGVILAAGFGVCAFSDFAPIARFGALSAFTILAALLGNLFLLPALLTMTPKKTMGRW
jgi:predicted RND superfamily exporter protein